MMKVFKLQLFSVTGVPPEQQKIVGLEKGTYLKDTTLLSSLPIKDVCSNSFTPINKKRNLKIDIRVKR